MTSSKGFHEISDSSWYVIDRTFSDENCKNQVFDTKRSVHYHLSGDSHITFDTSQEIEVLIEFHDESALQIANQTSFCEISDWEKGKPKEVEGRKCSWEFADGSRHQLGTAGGSWDDAFMDELFYKIDGPDMHWYESKKDMTKDSNPVLKRVD